MAKVIRRQKAARPGPPPRWTERIDASVSAEVREALMSEAERQGMTLSALVRMILTEWHTQRTVKT